MILYYHLKFKTENQICQCYVVEFCGNSANIAYSIRRHI